ncbi:ABC transporter ATP-binding protein [Nocardioides carbamazepini]|uniref:ABC transporter ATP-binding protein n=1 Tax=Nocardioides carbamazepini TaxID=2854259 RepID=UPI00214A0EF6|nr:ABC transporter ATP-binding protein [Nocardioides carbamazepini]MCR1786335.1 ABC transporter ATP-binding protein [Nocardioides carbamazepini]
MSTDAPMGAHGGLRAERLTVRYGGVTANADVDLDVRPGEIVGLIGPNGAGKTTFVDAVTGFTRSEGSVTLDGERIDALRPHERRRRGLSRTWQSGELFGNLTVRENVAVATRPGGVGTLFRDIFWPRRRSDGSVDRALSLVGLGDEADRLARDLSLGQQKLVGVARALVGTCKLLLLDEPAAGLDSAESLEFATRLRTIVREQGAGALLIDHDMSLVLGVCDRVFVLEFGKLIFSGTPDEARTDQAVVAAYLGVPMENADA